MSRFWCGDCGEPRSPDLAQPATPNGVPLCPECGAPLGSLDIDPLEDGAE